MSDVFGGFNFNSGNDDANNQSPFGVPETPQQDNDYSDDQPAYQSDNQYDDSGNDNGASEEQYSDDAPETEDNASEEAQPEETKTVAKKPKKERASKPKKVATGLTPSDVKAVLAAKEKLDNASDHVRALTANLLDLRDPNDDVKFIVALSNSDTVSNAKSSIKTAVELYALDDMQFAVKTSTMDRSERKKLWDLEAKIDPDKASEISNGKFPNDVMQEVSLLRRLQKESQDFHGSLNAVNELLA